MAATAMFHAASGPTSRVGRIRGIFSLTWAMLYAWRQRQVARKALHGLDDRMLNDIGLTRADIDAMNGAL